MQIFRYVVFVTLAIIAAAIIYIALALVMGLITWIIFLAYSKLHIVLFVLSFIFMGWILFLLLWGIFKTICVLIILFVRKISPSPKFAFFTFCLLIILAAIFNVYSLWGANEISALSVIINIIFTLTTIGFTGTMLKVSGHVQEDETHTQS